MLTKFKVAASNGHLAACQLLLDAGADPCATYNDYLYVTAVSPRCKALELIFFLLLRTPLHKAMSFHSYGEVEETIRSDLEEFLLKLIPKTQEVISECTGTFLHVNVDQILQSVIETVYPPWHQRPLSERIEILDKSYIVPHKAEVILLILTPKERKMISSYREQLLPIIVGRFMGTIYIYPTELDGYNTLLARVLRNYSSPLTGPLAYKPPRSLLMSFLRLWTNGLDNDHYDILLGQATVQERFSHPDTDLGPGTSRRWDRSLGTRKRHCLPRV